MGTILTATDEGLHEVGEADNWNESRYVDVWDPERRVGGWLRLGNRPNEGYAEMSVCINMPDGQVAFMFDRAAIEGNGLSAGGQSWQIIKPFVSTRVVYRGEVLLLSDPWALVDPKSAFTTALRARCEVDLTSHAAGLDSVMGRDQDHIERIFLPGQADFHYQHLVRTTGRMSVGGEEWLVEGLGGKDHSWGPRNWHAKITFRWLIAMAPDGFGFMLVRGVGLTKQTRSGFVWDDGRFHLVDDFSMKNRYRSAPNYELQEVEVVAHSGTRSWSATGAPVVWVPLRHRQEGKILRIVKSPTDWVFGDGRHGAGMCEYHDLLDGGVPVGLLD
jgi:hypothetical protein